MKMQRLDLTLTVLSPVHIGSGDVLDPTRYVVRAEGFYRINERAFYGSLSPSGRAALHNAIDSADLRRVWQAVKALFEPTKHTAYVATITPAIHKKCVNALQQGATQLELHECVKEQGSLRPIIPGSSLKGLVRTAVLQALLSRRATKPELQRLVTHWKKPRRGPKGDILTFPDTVAANDAPLTEGALLNALTEPTDPHKPPTFDIRKDPFRHLSVPDIILPPDCLEIVTVERVRHDTGESGGPPLLVEAIRPGTTATCSLSFAPAFFAAIELEPGALLQCVHNFTGHNLCYIHDLTPAPVQQFIQSITKLRFLAQLGAYTGRYAHALHLEQTEALGEEREQLGLPDPKTVCTVTCSSGHCLMGLVALATTKQTTSARAPAH